MTPHNLLIRLDPLIKTFIGEATSDPVFRAQLQHLGDLTIVHNGVIHLTDEALECWYQHREAKPYAHR